MLPEEIPQWAKSCPLGKLKFATAKQARDHAKNAKSGSLRGNAKPYPCDQCGSYHLTHDSRQHDKRKNGSGPQK